MLRIFKTKLFSKWAKKTGLIDNSIISAVNEIESGLVDANLGGNLYKKRVATLTSGKSGGYRTILAYKRGTAVFFLYGFEKNTHSNINSKEELALKELAKIYLAFSDKEIKVASDVGELVEVKDEKKYS